jgi:hypothetical protein
MHAVEVVVAGLERANLLVESKDDPPAYLPARDLGAISVRQLLETVRSTGEDGFLNPAGLPVPATVAQVLTRLDQALTAATRDVTLRDLAADPGVSLVKESASAAAASPKEVLAKPEV